MACRCNKSTMLTLALVVISSPLVAATHRYEVVVQPDLKHLEINACLSGKPGALIARDPKARTYLRSATTTDGARRLEVDDNEISLPTDTPCVRYRVDIRRAAASNPRYAGIDDTSIAVPTTTWLWLPSGQGATHTVVRFKLAGQHRVSVPWERVAAAGTEESYAIPKSPRSDVGVSAFGNFQRCELKVGGAVLRAALLPGKYSGNQQTLLSWLADAARNVTRAYGRFPTPSPQVIVIPGARHNHDPGEPVPFGHVIRDGGEAVQFYVNQLRTLEAFVEDWTATHEFAHLLIPYVEADEKWISEGLASYYQNVLMARGGRYTAAKAWQKIIEGFRRGEQSVPHLSLENAMPIAGWDGIMKTYWGGAAVFLMADVELRHRTGNKASLDSVLARLQQCCLPSPRSWDGARLFKKLDALAAEPVFTPLYEKYRGQRTFPPYTELMTALGIAPGIKRVRLEEKAPLAGIRRSIMAPAHATLEADVRCES